MGAKVPSYNCTNTEVNEESSSECVPEVSRAEYGLHNHHPVVLGVHHQVSEREEGGGGKMEREEKHSSQVARVQLVDLCTFDR